ncbi:WbuC family cupin fold metalloprotein [Teredinibacter purpureus]|uniref:WbuC family cupin fold metalloprotein n=1 Tax=Teredinibacter purpureus TaxID=2731756 RepID=UPI0005F7E09F|nr:WbuC family cupin fold metalloprotein [Teredinibacter purpureus]
MKVFDTSFFQELFEQAEQSARKRAHLNIHSSHQEKVQRLFIALVKGSYVEPHFHELDHQWEAFSVLRGVIEVKLYRFDGEVLSQFLVGEGQEAYSIEFQPNDIHSVECVTERALMLEVKEGPFNPIFAKSFPHWRDK